MDPLLRCVIHCPAWIRRPHLTSRQIIPADEMNTNSADKKGRKKGAFDDLFARARAEKRVILTTSKTMRERSACPPSHLVSTQNLEKALVEVVREYGLTLTQVISRLWKALDQSLPGPPTPPRAGTPCVMGWPAWTRQRPHIQAHLPPFAQVRRIYPCLGPPII